MGERKGTNKYYPPDYDPKKGGLNKFMGTHALRERARKLHLGIMIIRFEMPYNIWCEGCNNHIGMGVRYNAEKKKVGMYYSTPVYEFRMKCHLCDNHFEIKTDPGNLDYVIVSGARRQERRWDPTENGQVVPDDKQIIHKLADDAMFKLEHGVDDQKKLKDVSPSLSKLENLQERWKDDYMANRALRDIFRTRKRELQEKQARDTEFLKKRSLDIPLLQESEDDTKVASLIRLQPAKSVEERLQEKRSEIDKRSQFPFPLTTVNTATSSTLSSEVSGGQSVTKSADPQQSSLEQLRLSFGIKLKKDISIAPMLGSSKSPNAQVSGQTSEMKMEEYGKGATGSFLSSSSESTIGTTENDSSSPLGKLNSFESKCTSLQVNDDDNKQSSSAGGLSSLVSYSDDSSDHTHSSESEGDAT